MDDKLEKKYRVKRLGLNINVQYERYYPEGGEWQSAGICRTIDHFGGRLAKTMTDDEIIAAFIKNPEFFS